MVTICEECDQGRGEQRSNFDASFRNEHEGLFAAHDRRRLRRILQHQRLPADQEQNHHFAGFGGNSFGGYLPAVRQMRSAIPSLMADLATAFKA